MGAMKKLPSIVALLLGVAFIYFGFNFWFNPPNPPAGSFIALMKDSGYLGLIKGLEVIGGALLIFPRTRAWGLVLVGAVLFNIVCVHHFFGGLKDWTVITLVVAGLYLAWVGRKGFCCLACCGSGRYGCGCCGAEKTEGSCCSTQKSETSGGCCGGK